jgi:Na+/H+ antiporter NhaD/arsenite permease-like protein
MGHEIIEPNPWMVAPFALLLLSLALGPVVCPKAWARHYPKIACGLGAVTLVYYLAGLRAGGRVLSTGHEYLSFIVLIGSLFVVSGGIHINVKGEATPAINTLYLFIGAVLANFLGTTGASMLLIRPWIRMNKFRVTGHHIVFFIFIVSNVGGCLTPVGDPPLFLGYLKGVPFWWVAERCWPIWAVGVGFLLAVFYVVDSLNYRRAPREVRVQMTRQGEVWRFDGLGNLVWLLVILLAVFVQRPTFLREALMAAAAAGSYFTTSREVHRANHFDLHPVREVVVVFAGIFATMLPAMDLLQAHAGRWGEPSPTLLFWGSGLLSSLLDNAPTYLSFLSAIFGSALHPDAMDQLRTLVQSHGTIGPHEGPAWQAFQWLQSSHPGGLPVNPDQLRIAFLLGNPALEKCLLAISIAAVFFGANTYIANGPTFMVKSLADQQGARAPGFLAFILWYTLPCMLPMLILVWLLFFRS